MDIQEYSSQARERAESIGPVATAIGRVESVQHWELVTLMVLTGASIIGLYTLMLQFFRPLFGSIGFKLYLTLGYLLAAGLAYGQYRLQMQAFREKGRELGSDELPWLQDAAAELAAEMGIDVPAIRIVDDEVPNAFAAGSPSSGIVFFHAGLFDALSEEEAKAVLAHEFAHIKNRDSMVLVLATAVQQLVTRGAWVVGFVFAQVTSAIALAFRNGRDTVWAAQRRAYMRHRIVTVTTVVAALMVLLFSRLLSRYREFVADLTAARAIGDPKPMQDALESIHEAVEDVDPTPEEGGAAASLYIANGVESKVLSLFDSHPDFGKRTDVLAESFGQDEPAGATETGAVLGPVTKFGLTGAPAILVGVGVSFAVLLLLEIAGINALSAFDNFFGALLALVVFLAVLASIVTFPWAMLFADGGTAKYGFVAVVFVLVLLFVGSLPELPLIRHLDILAWLGLIGISGVQLRAVARELQTD